MMASHHWKRLALLGASALVLQSEAHAGGLSFVEYLPAAGPASPLRNVEAVVVSWPDGKNVYTAGGNADMLGVYSRDLGTGELTLLEVKEDGVGGVDGLRNNLGVAVSTDGKCVYATGQQDANGKVAVFSRDTTTGALTFVETQNVDRAEAVVVSPDGSHVYVSGTAMANEGIVQVFGRTPPACALTAIEQETGDVDGLGKGAPEALAFVGTTHLYVSGTFSVGGDNQGAVNVFSRNVGTGQLTFVEREYNGANGVERMANVNTLAPSLDGGHVIAGSRGDSALVVFARDGGTGELTFQEVHRDGGGIDGLKGIAAVVIDPNNSYVYPAAVGDASAAVFRRDPATGALRFLEVLKDPFIDPPNEVLPTGNAVDVSPLGEHLYVGGKGLTVFAIDSCANGTRGTDEQCDDGNLTAGDGCSSSCRLELCGPAPSGTCRGTSALTSQLQIKNVSPDTKDSFQFKWNAGDATMFAEFGDPLTSASYVICIYDASADPQPLLAAAAPAGGVCKKGKPCWKAATTSYKYNDSLYTPDGLQIVQLKEGLVNGKAKIQVKGRGLNLLPPTLPLVPPVTVQVHNTDTSVCWDAEFMTLDTNLPDKLKGKGN